MNNWKNFLAAILLFVFVTAIIGKFMWPEIVLPCVYIAIAIFVLLIIMKICSKENAEKRKKFFSSELFWIFIGVNVVIGLLIGLGFFANYMNYLFHGSGGGFVSFSFLATIVGCFAIPLIINKICVLEKLINETKKQLDQSNSNIEKLKEQLDQSKSNIENLEEQLENKQDKA